MSDLCLPDPNVMTCLFGAQLLLKAASNDKRFVVDEAQRATSAFARCLPSHTVLELLLPYATAHKAPKVSAAKQLSPDLVCAFACV